MIYFSYLFIKNIEYDHLNSKMNMTAVSVGTSLEHDQNELENILGFISNRIRLLILERGATFSDINNYLHDITSYYREQALINGFESVFAYLPVFDNRLSHGLYEPSIFEKFDSRSRVWYQVAVSNPETISETQIYPDAISGEVTFTLVNNVYDDNGDRIAIVCLDITIANLFSFLYNISLFPSNSWMLIDKNQQILSHSQSDFIGKKLSEINRDFARLGSNLMRRGYIENVFVKDHERHSRLVSIKEIKPDFHLVLAISAEHYENNLNSMLTVLISCGTFFSALLILLLMTVLEKKYKSVVNSNFLCSEQMIYQSTINSLPVAMIISRISDGTIVYANQTTQKLLGAKSLDFEVIGKNFCKFVPSFQHSSNLSSEPLDSDSTDPVEFCCRRLNGEEFYAQINSNQIRFGGEVCLLMAFEDKTIHRDYQKKLLDVAEKEKEQNDLKNKFFKSVSKEIRTPLNATLVLAELQLAKPSLSEKEKITFSRIYNTGSLLLKIITDMLDITKMDKGSLELYPAEYDLITLVNEIKYINDLRCINKPVNFRVSISSGTPTKLIGDELRIKQILNNVLSNAFKYTREGEVSLNISSAYSGSDMLLTFIITDTGKGMTSDEQCKLFMKMDRFNEQDNRNIVGTGLGLYITKLFINAMNGTVMVDSKPGVGTTFTIQLPQGLENN
jgi:PAS domain S-box-containing protein